MTLEQLGVYSHAASSEWDALQATDVGIKLPPPSAYVKSRYSTAELKRFWREQGTLLPDPRGVKFGKRGR